MKVLEPLTLVGKFVRLKPLRLEDAAALLAAADEGRATYAFATVPSDLGGVLYLELADRKDITPIEARLRQQIEAVIEGKL